MSLSSNLREYLAACFTGVWIESHEHADALGEIAQLCRDENWRLAVWDIDQGVQIPGQQNSEADGGNPLAAIRAINRLASPDSSALLVLENFHKFLGSPEVLQALAHQVTTGNQNRTFLKILSPVVEIRCIYHEELEFKVLGQARITRASHLKPTADGRWTADLTSVGGPVLGPFARRTAALATEHAWLQRHWLEPARHRG